MTSAPLSRPTVHAQHAGRDRFLRDIVAGFARRPKTLPCKYLYDERGSTLFERICGLPEYYPTRTELGIMERNVAAMAEALGPSCLLVELGSGSGLKTERLLQAMHAPVAYVPIDIAATQLQDSAARLAARFPDVAVLPLCADFAEPLRLPRVPGHARRHAVYFPGSTIGNFTPGEARRLLSRLRESCGTGAALLIGVDLVKDRHILERAYDDMAGVTAAFNLNILERINRELDADFVVGRFRHRAVYDPVAERVEMRLHSLARQTVRIGGRNFLFASDEHVVTEYSHKYRLPGFVQLAASAGWRVDRIWCDPDELFSVQYLVAL